MTPRDSTRFITRDTIASGKFRRSFSTEGWNASLNAGMSSEASLHLFKADRFFPTAFGHDG